MKRILVINNYDSFVYNLIQILRENPSCRFDIAYNDHIDFSSLSQYDKILLSPGPGIPEEAGQLLQLVEYCKNTHSILGVCLGHQAIALTFGAKLKQLSLPRHGHASTLTLSDSRDSIYQNTSTPFTVGRYHSWVVDPHTLPASLQISATDEDGNIMSLYHRSLPIHGVQYHPESIITRQGRILIDNWINE